MASVVLALLFRIIYFRSQTGVPTVTHSYERSEHHVHEEIVRMRMACARSSHMTSLCRDRNTTRVTVSTICCQCNRDVPEFDYPEMIHLCGALLVLYDAIVSPVA